jgi:hypothetical protein
MRREPPSGNIAALLVVEQVGQHDLIQQLLMHSRIQDRVSASTRRSRLRGIRSAEEM